MACQDCRMCWMIINPFTVGNFAAKTVQNMVAKSSTLWPSVSDEKFNLLLKFEHVQKAKLWDKIARHLLGFILEGKGFEKAFRI